MSILSAIRQQSGSIDDLAKLPQAMIMQMAQKKQIATEMVAPILARKAEMIDAAAKSKAMQGGLPQTSVMEQIMAQNSAAEQPQQMQQQMPTMENSGVAQLPVPERAYAGGGIVAFARGSLIDDDEEIDASDDYAKAAAMVQRANAMPVGMPATMPAAMPTNAPAAMPVNAPAAKPSILPQSYETALAEKGQTPASVRKMMIDSPKKGDYVMPPMDVLKRGGHKYEDMVIKEANRLGVDPSLALHVLYKETGNIKNPETAKSSAGALGVMQLMPKTAKGLGVDPLNPEENIRGGVTYLKQMYDRYQDPTLALAAYNAGPGRLDKALKSGQGISGLPRETQNYIVANRMASGGEVKHFDTGGLNKPFTTDPRGITRVPQYPLTVYKGVKKLSPYSKFMSRVPYLGAALTAAGGIDALVESDEGTASEFLDPIAAMQGTQGGYERNKKENIYDQMAKDVKAENSSKQESSVPTQKTFSDEDTGPYLNPNSPAAAAAAAVPTPVKEKTAFEMFIEQNDLDRAALGKQRKDDQNMALLAAGLGMLGGESPYAFSNIGKGGLSGVSYLSEANKQRAAEKAALDKNRVAAMHYANIGDYYKSNVLDKEERQKLGQQKLEETAFANATRYRDMMLNRLKAEGFDPTLIAALPNNDPQKKAFNQRLFEIENDPYLLEQYRKAGMPLKEKSVAASNVRQYDSKGKEIK
jgi:soluble lytic murein transglycosylase-like protein